MGYFKMAQKAIEGGMNHVKSYAFDLEIAQLQNGSKTRQKSEMAQNSNTGCTVAFDKIHWKEA